MANNRMSGDSARVRAQQIFAKSEQRKRDALREMDKASSAESLKTERLRALRLAKEASDKAEAEKTASKKKPAKRTPSDGA